jgi:hypothetical protein
MGSMSLISSLRSFAALLSGITSAFTSAYPAYLVALDQY